MQALSLFAYTFPKPCFACVLAQALQKYILTLLSFFESGSLHGFELSLSLNYAKVLSTSIFFLPAFIHAFNSICPFILPFFLLAVFNLVSKVISRLHYYGLWLVNKTHATFSTNGKYPNQNQSCFRHLCFPALGTSYMYLLRILIGSLCCLHLLRLARVITLVLVLRHSIGNHSMIKTSYWD